MTDTLARAIASADDHTIDRRKLLKVGAWAAPVVVLAAAVPAAAASGTTQLSVTAGATLFYTWTDTTPTGIGGAVTLGLAHTAGSGGSATPVSIVVSVDASGLAAANAPTVVSGAGWTPAGVSGPTNGRLNYTFTYAPSLAAGGSTATLVFVVPAATGFSQISTRSWTIAASGTGVNATVSGATATGTVVSSIAAVTGTPNPNPSGKTATISASATAAISVRPRLSVKRTHQSDRFDGKADWSLSTEGTGKTATDIAVGPAFSGADTLHFPTYVTQSGLGGHDYKIDFLLGTHPVGYYKPGVL
ncbi:hypothetical protein ACLBXX_13035 [Microbacterium sp. C23T]